MEYLNATPILSLLKNNIRINKACNNRVYLDVTRKSGGSMSNKLIIVGNGFDLAHGLKTNYTDFITVLPEDIKEEWQGILNEYDLSNPYWYNFENLISDVTLKWFQDEESGYFISIAKQKDVSVLENRIEYIYRIFSDIENRLSLYLLQEQKKIVKKRKNISEYIAKDDLVISFNYTDTAKLYSENTFFIHGSLQEGFILLGYKSGRIEHDLIDPKATKRAKRRLRELLSYHRFLVSHGISNEELGKYLDDFNIHLDCLFSGRGDFLIDYSSELEKEIKDVGIEIYDLLSPHPDTDNIDDELKNCFLEKLRAERLTQVPKILNDYMEQNHFNLGSILPEIDFKNIQEIGVLGHSLEADDDIISKLLLGCQNLAKVVLFSYNGESLCELESKQEKLKLYFNGPIEIHMY